MSLKEKKCGRPKKETSAFNSVFIDLIGKANQQEVADKIGGTRQNVGRWISGETTPDINTLVKIANAYNVSTDYLLGRTETKTLDEVVQAAVKDLGISEKSAENIRSITQSGSNVNILFERNEFKSIVTLLNRIKTIAVGRRYYNTVIVPNIESNCLLDSLLDSSDYNSHARLSSYITYAVSQLIEYQFSDDISVSGSLVGSQANCDNLYNEKLVLTEYQFTEHVIRTIINDLKNDATTDNKIFTEFDERLGDNLDYLLLNLQSNLEDAPKHYTGEELDKRKQEIQEDIELLDKFIKFYDEHYRKDSENNG